MSQGFIEQTAHDYDIPEFVVERIAKLFPNEFYEKLEEYLTRTEQLKNTFLRA